MIDSALDFVIAMPKIAWNDLFEAARAARTRAHAVYSRFQVGAAIWCSDGSIVAGCNVENASYGLTLCAERNAIAAMVLAGKTPMAVAIVADSTTPTPPCGACRQVLAEFSDGSLEVRSQTSKGIEDVWQLKSLLPHAFTRQTLEDAVDLPANDRSLAK